MKGVFAKAPTAWTILLLALFLTVWTAYPSLTRLNLDRYGDMLENYSWGIAWQAGYYKHPPLFAWITAAWFSLFPNADWAYYLLSAFNAMVAVLASWRIALRFLDPRRAFFAAALFFFLPPVTFLAIKYNANAAMLPFWPLTVLFYLRLLERRRIADAVLLGLLAAAAILTKYHSAVLLAAIGLHLLSDREARPVLRSAAAWVACAVFMALLAPHAIWLVQNDFQPVTYAAGQGGGTLEALVSIPTLLVAMVLYSLPAVLVLLIALSRNNAAPRFSTAGLRELPRSVRGRALLWSAFGPLALTLLLGLAFMADLSSVWALPMFFPVPLLLLLAVAPGGLEHRPEVVPLIVLIYCTVLIAAAPIVKRLDRSDARYEIVPVRAVAGELEKAWAAHTDAPLTIVSGDKILASGASFYAPSRPYSMQAGSFALTPWVTPEAVMRKGIAVVCFQDQAYCEEQAARFPVTYNVREDVTVPGPAGTEWPIRFFIALPQESDAPDIAVRSR